MKDHRALSLTRLEVGYAVEYNDPVSQIVHTYIEDRKQMHHNESRILPTGTLGLMMTLGAIGPPCLVGVPTMLGPEAATIPPPIPAG